jgi:hypothetical protein
MEQPKMHLVNKGSPAIFVVVGKRILEIRTPSDFGSRPRKPTAAFIARVLQIEVFMIGRTCRRAGRGQQSTFNDKSLVTCYTKIDVAVADFGERGRV